MCGICGVINKTHELVQRDTLEKMCSILYHRGPDDMGTVMDRWSGMGMRRLSIIDLEGGSQPIHNEDKTIWVVLNGEIYNYQNLTRMLVEKGHDFYTKSDTEVIVHLYEEFGEKCVTFLRGMFAFAIWDSKREKLILGRDRIGIKPLYYYLDSDYFIFGSEIKSILQHPRPCKELDYSAVDAFFHILYIPAPRTIYKNIHKLPPGHILVFQNGNLTIEQYWELRYEIDKNKSFSDISQVFLDKFREAVKIRLISDVPLGALLSGGVDSSAVVACMSELSSKPVETFTAGYNGVDVFDESQYARLIANQFGTQHHEIHVQPNIEELIPSIVWFFDEPFADSSAIPNYYISQLAKRFVTVALSGLGGDEIAAGYERYIGLLMSKYYERIPRFLRERLIVRLSKMLPDSKKGRRFTDRVKRFVDGGTLPINERYFSYISFPIARARREFYLPHIHALLDGELEKQFNHYFFQYPNLQTLNRALFVDLKMYLPGDLLTLTDRMSMAHSLEVRVPFLDHELIELVATISPEHKLHGFSKKYLLKKAFENILPKEILYRKKEGFSMPLAIWFRNDLNDYVRRVLTKERIERIGIFKYEKVAEILNSHFQAKDNFHSQIWALIMFSIWHEMHVENTITNTPSVKQKYEFDVQEVLRPST